MWNDGSSGWCSATDPKRPLRSGPDSSRPFPSRYSTAAVGPRTAAASAGTADFPPSALPAAGRFRAPPSPGQPLSPARPPTLNSWRRFSGQRASGPGWTCSSQPFSAVALFRTADFAAVLALAFLSAAHRLFVAAMIRARPSGLRRRFFPAACAGTGGAAAAMRRRGGAYDALGRFAKRGLDRPFEALRPRDQYPHAAAERARGDPGFARLREALPGGGHRRLDALAGGLRGFRCGRIRSGASKFNLADR